MTRYLAAPCQWRTTERVSAPGSPMGPWRAATRFRLRLWCDAVVYLAAEAPDGTWLEVAEVKDGPAARLQFNRSCWRVTVETDPAGVADELLQAAADLLATAPCTRVAQDREAAVRGAGR